MPGRILWIMIAVVAAVGTVAACSRRDSLYIEPGKDQPSERPSHAAPPARR